MDGDVFRERLDELVRQQQRLLQEHGQHHERRQKQNTAHQRGPQKLEYGFHWSIGAVVQPRLIDRSARP